MASQIDHSKIFLRGRVSRQATEELGLGLYSDHSMNGSTPERSNVAKTARHRNSASQVRFSLPDPKYIESSTNSDSLYSPSTSPLKIVFPKDPEDYEALNDSNILNEEEIRSQGHFMNLTTKTMIDVPEDIWKFHQNHRAPRNGHRKSKSTDCSNAQGGNHVKPLIYSDPVISGHKRSKSLQSIISDTINLYKSETLSASTNDSTSIRRQVTPLDIPSSERLKPRKDDLYLTPESPLNRYNIPIPLEIKLPPFLSPQNNNKKRRSLVYDGAGYSFCEDKSEESALTLSEEEYSNSIVSSVDLSIPSATYDISFDMKDSNAKVTDELLGIDEHANVDLKLQNRNLRKPKILEKQGLPNTTYERSNDLQYSVNVPGTPKGGDNAPSDNSKPKITARTLGIKGSSNARDSLKILSTPSKQIIIPDLERNPLSSQKSTFSNGTLSFFEKLQSFENNDQLPENDEVEWSETGKLNCDFKFPSLTPSEDYHQHHTEEHQNLQFFNASAKNISRVGTQFEEDEKFSKDFKSNLRLMRNPASPSRTFINTHRRSRSIRSVDLQYVDLQSTSPTSTKYVGHQSERSMKTSTNIGPQVPARSSLRPVSPSSNIYEPDNTSEQSDEDSITSSYSDHENTESSAKILFERPAAKNLPKEARPLSSFQSFSSPISDYNLELEYTTYEDTHPVLPTRQLSNVGSKQSASTINNSEFSHLSYKTDLTLPSSPLLTRSVILEKHKRNSMALREEDAGEKIANRNVPLKKILDYETVQERIGGKLVDVIVLDDIEEGKNTQKSKVPNRKRYTEVLEMCEKTAQDARCAIYDLVKNETCNETVTGKRSAQLFEKQAQQERYLRNLNRSIKIRSRSKSNFN
ncbi:hypothetical protein KAFR_0I02420 [Kazachstania africana CBS 2517]|uniref:Uncharacterized protein n=1 Tax=Kazachstania africana (strain ATCC 22294 / BCRC 22015 / CBS 2517 / CECT 1963 / NBRC 1671 / NRRL Y-8276) TaxID=1071382 RepID=H2B071_KAZAF|nr:hypothetical protein KAFR_0I02420 [Kazachstania africana CBS 2517]CCF60021.1 hypothetical protein KAFR_0I02420 [Kazachstania africana CBS 2517]